MDLNDLRSAVTLFSFCFFIALAVWAWLPTRRADLDAAEQLPFLGEDDRFDHAHSSAPAHDHPTRSQR